ncbi:MAG: DUF3598 family protein [Bdellovibrionaceae bacterium]|nr:DUF3598 family protein [Pseudobdellovibrionaceae bacterium]NUM59277.1 hypothetical protein [Pseudobdellovibrionaceae bacterium]
MKDNYSSRNCDLFFLIRMAFILVTLLSLDLSAIEYYSDPASRNNLLNIGRIFSNSLSEKENLGIFGISRQDKTRNSTWEKVFLNQNWQGVWVRISANGIEQESISLNCKSEKNDFDEIKYFCELVSLETQDENYKSKFDQQNRFREPPITNQLILSQKSFFYVPMSMRFSLFNNNLIGLELDKNINFYDFNENLKKMGRGEMLSEHRHNINMECDKVKHPLNNPLGICAYIILSPKK